MDVIVKFCLHVMYMKGSVINFADISCFHDDGWELAIKKKLKGQKRSKAEGNINQKEKS